jgi:hypothetical protein
MIKLPAGLELRRLAAYAAIAALVTGVLFAADGAYRWYGAESAQITPPSMTEQTAAAPKATPMSAPMAAPAEPSAASAPAQNPAVPSAETAKAEKRFEEPSATAQAPSPAGGPTAATPSASGPALATVPSGAIPPSVTGIAPETETRSVDVTLQNAPPPLPPSRQELRTPSAKQITRERAAQRRTVQAAEKPVARAGRPAKQPAELPNVYWERDEGSQLGFAPQLRKKTCDPATGQMPMQCYYPREGRERFPAKPLN